MVPKAGAFRSDFSAEIAEIAFSLPSLPHLCSPLSQGCPELGGGKSNFQPLVPTQTVFKAKPAISTAAELQSPKQLSGA